MPLTGQKTKSGLRGLASSLRKRQLPAQTTRLRGQLGFRAEAVSRGTVACTIETGLQHFPYLLSLRTLSMVVGSGRK